MKKILPMSALLSFLMLFGLAVQAQKSAPTNTNVVEAKIKTTAVCNDCKTRLEHHMKFEKGVKSANLDLESKVLTVAYQPKKTNEAKLRTAITKAGYMADGVPANKKAYAKLPACCKDPKTTCSDDANTNGASSAGVPAPVTKAKGCCSGGKKSCTKNGKKPDGEPAADQKTNTRKACCSGVSKCKNKGN